MKRTTIFWILFFATLVLLSWAVQSARSQEPPTIEQRVERLEAAILRIHQSTDLPILNPDPGPTPDPEPLPDPTIQEVTTVPELIAAVANGGAIQLLDPTYALSKALIITKPVTITGPGVISRAGTDLMLIRASDCTFNNVTIQGATNGVKLDADLAPTNNITFDRCT